MSEMNPDFMFQYLLFLKNFSHRLLRAIQTTNIFRCVHELCMQAGEQQWSQPIISIVTYVKGLDILEDLYKDIQILVGTKLEIYKDFRYKIKKEK